MVSAVGIAPNTGEALPQLTELQRWVKARCGLQFEGQDAPKLLRAELYVHPVDNPLGLNGSGLAIANPPWGLEAELLEWLPWLATQLAQSQGSWQLDWVIEEKKPA